MRTALPLGGLALLLAGGCVLDDVDLTGKACPCAEGWTCDEATSRCVEGAGATDGGATDGGPRRDAGPGPTDAGPSPTDAGASPTDGGPSPADGGPSPVDGGPTPMDGGPTPVDGGPPPTDAGPDETVCDELSGAIFCDGFETSFIAWDSTIEVSGSVTAGTTETYRGTRALSSVTTAGSGKAAVEADFTPVTSGPLHLRAYMYVPGTLDSEGISFLFMGELVSPYFGVALQITALERVELYNGTEDVFVASTPVAFPRDRWVCVQVSLDVANSGSAMAWIDGTLVASESGIDTLPDGGYGQLVAGIEWSSPSQLAATIYTDEVVLSTSPVPCD